jgi:hypothetical protein
MEGRPFVGIEKNDDLERFKSEDLDCLDVAHRRLDRARERLGQSEESPGQPSGDGASEAAYDEGETMSLFQDMRVREVRAGEGT